MSFHGNFDLEWLKLINQPTLPILDLYLFPILSYSIYIYLLFTAFYFFKKHRREKFIHLFITVLIGFVVASGLKYLFNVQRPFIAFPNDVHALLFSLDPSFPSRHTFIAFLLLRFVPQNFPKIYRYMAIFYLLSIPLIQMHIGAHYPTDVLGGALLGFVFPALLNQNICLKIWEKFPKKILPF